jgi:hypothetical protein
VVLDLYVVRYKSRWCSGDKRRPKFLSVGQATAPLTIQNRT